ncbi:MAG: hypothetical protein AB1Z57_03120 [Acidimicrobiia bacterium]
MNEDDTPIDETEEPPGGDASTEAEEPTHEADDEWSAAGQQIRALGSAVRSHYEAPGEGEEPGPSPDELREAARAFGRGLGRFFGAIGDAARDPEVKEQASRAGTSMLNALGATFDQLGKEASEAFSKARDGQDEGEEDDLAAAAQRELDDADLLEELKTDLAEDEDPGTT